MYNPHELGFFTARSAVLGLEGEKFGTILGPALMRNTNIMYAWDSDDPIGLTLQKSRP